MEKRLWLLGGIIVIVIIVAIGGLLLLRSKSEQARVEQTRQQIMQKGVQEELMEKREAVKQYGWPMGR
jgi:septation ring formation regulator EzrA